MPSLLRLLALPAPLLILLTTAIAPAATEKSWPYNLPPHQKYFPEHEPIVRQYQGHDKLVRRHVEVSERLATQAPIGMKKMSGDPDEMFLPEYWVFDELPSTQPTTTHSRSETTSLRLPTSPLRSSSDSRPGNLTSAAALLPPFLPHSDYGYTPRNSRNLPRNIFAKRAYQCPSGTKACNGIQRPDSCCATDETCMIIQDTGLGDVGCCPQGQQCGGSVSSCDTASGYHSCPGSPNGGCCIPNYACHDVGCILNSQTSTTRVVVTAAELSTITTTYYIAPMTTVETVVQTVTVAPSVSAAATTCSPGFNSCAASLGGGCCSADRVCGNNDYCGPLVTQTVIEQTTVTGIVPAVRPTGSESFSLDTSTSVGICPTGYYMCSAYYIGGCCQVGRDCSMTNCPMSATTTVISGSAVVVVPTYVGSAVPTTPIVYTISGTPAPTDNGGGVLVGATAASQTLATGGTCQNGWYGCGAAGGGGCCPTGYVCGQSCSATVGGVPDEVSKQISSTTALFFDACGRWLLVAAAAVGLLMVYL